MSQSLAVRFEEIVQGKSLLDLSKRARVSRRTLYRLRDGYFSPEPHTRRATAEALELASGVVIVYPADVAERETK